MCTVNVYDCGLAYQTPIDFSESLTGDRDIFRTSDKIKNGGCSETKKKKNEERKNEEKNACVYILGVRAHVILNCSVLILCEIHADGRRRVMCN